MHFNTITFIYHPYPLLLSLILKVHFVKSDLLLTVILAYIPPLVHSNMGYAFLMIIPMQVMFHTLTILLYIPYIVGANPC